MTITAVQERRLRDQLKGWRDELVNLTRRNRLLYFQHTRTASLELIQPGAQSILDRLNATGRNDFWGFSFFADQDARDTLVPFGPSSTDLVVDGKSAQQLEQTLRLLERKTNQEFVDKGLWILYLGLGVVDWVDPDNGKRVQSPILLVPVSFSRDNLEQPFHLRRTEDDSVINPALALKFATQFNIELPTIDDVGDTDLKVRSEERRVG